MQEEIMSFKGSPQDSTPACLWTLPKSLSLPVELAAQPGPALCGYGSSSSAGPGDGGGGFT